MRVAVNPIPTILLSFTSYSILRREDAKGEHSLYSLSWTLVFPHARDRCYFAHCYPYTYTDLQVL